jgi:CDP-paratose 2-epimerase
VTEAMRIDWSKHSIFGASKVAADEVMQEYGRYFGMKTDCLRAGCLTGPNHSGVELHGFLPYLVKTQLIGETSESRGIGESRSGTMSTVSVLPGRLR